MTVDMLETLQELQRILRPGTHRLAITLDEETSDSEKDALQAVVSGDLAERWRQELAEHSVARCAARLLVGTLSTYPPHSFRHPDNIFDEYMDLARANVMVELAQEPKP